MKKKKSPTDLKVFMALMLILISVADVWAENKITIEFLTNSSDGTTEISSSTPVSDVVYPTSTSYITGFTSNCSCAYYKSQYGVKLGLSTSPGTLEFTLASNYQNVISIKVESRQWGSGSDSGTLSLYVNGEGTPLESGKTPGADFTHTFSSPTYVETIKLATSTKRAYIFAIIITYEEPSTSVASITLDNSAKSIEVGEHFTLTPTIKPSSAANKNVTWSSSNTGVATVADGLVTGIAEGTATITATTADGGYTATCAVTVTPAVGKTEFIIDLTKDYTTTATADEISWVNPIISIVNVRGSDGTACNTYYPGTADQSYTDTRFYSNSVLTITPLNGLGIAKMEFTATEDTYATKLCGSTWTNANAEIDESDSKVVVVRPTDGTSAFSATIGGVCRLTQIKIYYTGTLTATLSVSAAKWATFIAPFDCTMESGVRAYTAAESADAITFTEVTTTIPANTPVVVYKDVTSSYTKAYTGMVTSHYATYTSGALIGVLKATTGITADDGKTNYVLQNNSQSVGFYRVASDGTISLKANRAYMSITTPSEAKGVIELPDDTPTGISKILNATNKATEGIFDLSGRRLAAPQKGINIINGVKVIVM